MAKHSVKKKGISLPDLGLKSLPRLHRGRSKKKSPLRYSRDLELKDLAVLLIGIALFLLSLLIPLPIWARKICLGLSSLVSAFMLLRRCLNQLFRGELPLEDLAAILAAVLAFALGEPIACAISLILYRFLDAAEAYALRRSEAAVDLLRDSLPEKARLETGGGVVPILPEELEPDDILVLDPGEALAADGVVVDGISEMDPSALTGNSKPISVSAGDEVLSGCRNLSAPLRIRLIRRFEDSAASKLLQTVEETDKQRTKLGAVAQRGGRIWRIGACALAVLTGLFLPLGGMPWSESLRRAAIILLLTSPSSLVISVSVSYLGAHLSALRQGIVFKSRAAVDKLSHTAIMAFGKTGTITEGNFTVTEVFPVGGISEQQLLTVTAAAESRSRHPIAQCLRQAGGWTEELAAGMMEVEEIPGRGVSAFIEGRWVYVGNAALLEEHGIWCAKPSRPGTAIHVAVENVYWGHIMLSDKVREGAFDALEALRSLGVQMLVMLTGDVLSSSRTLAQSLVFDRSSEELNTKGKISRINTLRNELADRRCIAYVSDGIHDEAVMKAADLGITLNALKIWENSESASVLLMDDELQLLPSAMRIAESVSRMAAVNMIGLGGIKVLLLILALVGLIPISAAAVVQTLVSVLALYNALRAFDLE